MTEGSPCPQCEAINRPEAKFCIECGNTLNSISKATVPLSDVIDDYSGSPNPGSGGSMMSSPASESSSSNTKTRPLINESSFDARPTGAIFGDLYISDQLIFTNESQHQYTIKQVSGSSARFRLCTNSDCGAVNPPNDDSAIYCTDCGTEISTESPQLILIETPALKDQNVTEIAKKILVHGSVRAPIDAFNEDIIGDIRYCVVRQKITELVQQPEAWQVLDWSAELAYGLFYLHTNGITFNGKVAADRFALDDGRAVWSNFTGCSVNSLINESDQQADTRAFITQLYNWISGKNQFEPEPYFPADLNELFRLGMSSSGYTSAFELGLAFEGVLNRMLTLKAVDYQSGRQTDVGMTRSLNEDSLLVIETSRVLRSETHPIGIYLVADGMGGHTAGEVASMTAVNSVAKRTHSELLSNDFNNTGEMDYTTWLQHSVQAANKDVYDIRKTTGSDLGSTLVAALLENNNAYIANVGDSRAYLINARGIQQITTDHSLVERLIATGQITREEARSHPQRNVIYRTIGDQENVEIDIDSLTLENGDKLLLCSDGLSGMITDENILRIVNNAASPQAACKLLIDAANAAGGDDNITVIIIEISSS